MGYLVFENNHRTLQTSYDIVAPEFIVTGKNYVGFSSDSWLLVEQNPGADNMLRPGEYVLLAEFDSFDVEFDESSVAEYRYEGLVDLDDDGWLDSVVLSDFLSEIILTELDQFINFSPFSTTVALNKVQTETVPLGPGLPPIPEEPSRDPLFGTRSSDDLRGTSDDDIIFGRSGDDLVTAKGGDDLVDGGGGDDLINGGGGSDSIWGGKGLDSIYGGRGRDDFWFDEEDSYDKVRDFRTGDELVIDGEDGDFASARRRDIEIDGGRRYDKLYVLDDLVARVYGDAVTMDDIFLLT